jgi:hypothetical protein
MALTHWTFVYAAGGITEDGDLRIVSTGASTTVLAGFPSAAAARAAFGAGPLAAELGRTQLIELCGAFSHDDVVTLRTAYPGVPVGLVTYAGDMTGQLHAIFGG